MTNNARRALNRPGKFMINGLTLTLGALLMRTVALAFNSYVAGEVGAEAIGLYSLLSGIYGFALTLALSGVSLSVTRLVAESLAVGDSSGVIKIMKRAFGFAVLFGVIASAVLFFISEAVASSYLHELRVIRPLKLLCITLPAAAISSVMNGYFTAVRRVYKNAISQSLEMLVKIGATVVLFCAVARRDAEIACSLLALGGIIAEIIALIFNAVIYAFDRKRYIGKTPQNRNSPCTGKRILEISMPVALTTYVRSALVSLEHSLIPKGLIRYGIDKTTALASYGTLGSMALTVVNFPYALIGSFSTLMITEVTESRAQGKKRHVRYLAYRAYQVSSVFSFLLLGIFFEFSFEIGNLLYSSELAGEYIRLLAFAAPIMYTDTVTDSLLKGMGEQIYSMKVNIVDAVISVFLVWLLVPRFGVMGYIITIYVAEIINASFSIARAVGICGIDSSVIIVYAKSALSTVGALAICRLFANILGAGGIVKLTAYILSYFIMVNITMIFSADDLSCIKNIFRRNG